MRRHVIGFGLLWIVITLAIGFIKMVESVSKFWAVEHVQNMLGL